MSERLRNDDHAALRRVATLVAEHASAGELFTAVAEEVARHFEVSSVMLARYDGDRTAVVLASLNEPNFTPGSRRRLDGPSVAATVLDTGRPARIDDDAGSVVGVPILVDATVWGVVTIGLRGPGALPEGSEDRLRVFTALVATAISNAESRDRLRRLADEQAALRRVATLVAYGATTAALSAAVVDAVVEVLGVPSAWLVRYERNRSMTVVASVNDESGFTAGSRWPLEGESLSRTILETGEPARVDDFTDLTGAIADRTRASGINAVSGAPIRADGSVWGFICVGAASRDELPDDTEARLLDFTELVATAISKAESDEQLRRLAAAQAGLRRVATLVAEGATPTELFAAVAEEVVGILDVTAATVVQYDRDGSSVVVASFNDPAFPVGSRWSLSEPSINAEVFTTGRPARIDHTGLPGSAAATARASGMQSGVGVPIIVDGSVWGMVAVGSRHRHEPLPPETEDHLAAFTDLVATAIANALAHDDLSRLATEQAALRRVATLVARAAPPAEVVGAVAEEVARVFSLPAIEIVRYESDRTATVIANSGGHLPLGSRWPLDGPSIMESVYRTGRPARIADYSGLSGTIAAAARGGGVRFAIGAPIVVEDVTWGAIIATSATDDDLPEGLEVRLSLFTELVATAVSNLQAHDDLRTLASQQAALRRVATLIAEGAPAEELFSAVATEVAQVLGVPAALLERYEPDGTAITLAISHDPDWRVDDVLGVGMRWAIDPGSLNAAIQETGRAARIDDYSQLEGATGDVMRLAGVGSGSAAPIVVGGTLWGSIHVLSPDATLLPAGIEARLHHFTEIVATAVSNVAARTELIASRARIVAAGDEARRRIERNLHDGTQQRLIALSLDVQRIRDAVAEDQTEVREGLDRMEEDLESLLEEVRELSRGLHPPLLSRRGLRPSLRALARRSPIPVDIDVELHERPPAAIETALYYVVAEAVTNSIKHSLASAISVTVETDHAGVPFGIGLDGSRGIVNLHATIADDGIGGAEATEGSGLMGLADRVDALGGRFVLDSPPGSGTRISIVLPMESTTA